jgi:predicted amidohydrolase YtcJ
LTSPTWAGSERVLLYGGTIYSPVSPFATAMLVEGDTIAWLGEDSAAEAHRDAADVVVDLRGALVTPGFVDAHVHTTSAGLTLAGLDLSQASSLQEALGLLEHQARALRGGVILGHGWDDTRWPEGRPPTRTELDRASWGSVVYLSRIDVHSAAVSSALIAAVPGVRDLVGFDPDLPLTQQAHHAVREAALASVTSSQRRDAQRAARRHAAALGVVCLHEMAGPSISGVDDLADLTRMSAEEAGPVVFGYWGELAQEGGIERARAAGAFAVGGDLSVDGALGSRTACLSSPYLDSPDTRGARYLTTEAITEHILLTSDAGYQTAFHCIGDAACQSAVDGFASAARTIGSDRVRQFGHRLEHAEMVSDASIATMADLGIVASMQPMFDALWGGSGGMYEQRLGADRSSVMNRVADLTSAGVVVALGSDAPVTPLGPWAAVRAAMLHHSPSQRVSARSAFSSHTRGGWRAVGQADAGVLAPGAPAHYALWDVADVVVQAPDERLSAWSTDPRSGTPGLPSLSADGPVPACVRTAAFGRIIHDTFEG